MAVVLLIYYLILPNGDISRNELVMEHGSTMEDCHRTIDRLAFVPPVFIDGSVWIGGYCAEVK